MTTGIANQPDCVEAGPLEPPPRARPHAAADKAPDHRTIIEPPRNWQLINVRELWQYRELLFFLTWRDVKVRYKQTVLGVAWAILQPAMMMVIFVVFFGRLAGVSTGGIPQPLFFLCGILPWFFFSTAVNSAANSVVGSERLITKIYFPRLAVPFSAVMASAVDFFVASSLLVVILGGYAIAGYPIIVSWKILLVPVVFGLILLIAAGLGTLLSALNVAYRDFRYIVPFFIQMGMFATPAIYMQPRGDEGRIVQFLLVANPMNSLIETFRASLLGGPVPWAALGVTAVIAAATFLVGCLYFRRVEDRFADIV